jgi:hypothetical protein
MSSTIKTIKILNFFMIYSPYLLYTLSLYCQDIYVYLIYYEGVDPSCAYWCWTYEGC